MSENVFDFPQRPSPVVNISNSVISSTLATGYLLTLARLTAIKRANRYIGSSFIRDRNDSLESVGFLSDRFKRQRSAPHRTERAGVLTVLPPRLCLKGLIWQNIWLNQRPFEFIENRGRAATRGMTSDYQSASGWRRRNPPDV